MSDIICIDTLEPESQLPYGARFHINMYNKQQ